jgi:FkbM family methyltransferase
MVRDLVSEKTAGRPARSVMPDLKSRAQAFLMRIGLYHRLKASILYDVYWGLIDKRLVEYRTREIGFYQALLEGFRPGDVIFDVGANIGAKTDVFLRLGARVIAIEPDQTNQGVLTDRFFSYRIRKKPVVVVGEALSDRNSVETMWIDEPGSAKNTLSRKWVDALRNDQDRFGERLDFAGQRQVVTTTLEDLMRRHGRPMFVKIDVEGAEPLVLRGLRSPVPYVSFEVNLPEFRPEGLECVELLGRLSTAGRFNYATDCQGGFGLPQWLGAVDFMRALQDCAEPSIEVFWASHVPRTD